MFEAKRGSLDWPEPRETDKGDDNASETNFYFKRDCLKAIEFYSRALDIEVVQLIKNTETHDDQV